MFQLIESIWINRGRLMNFPYHQSRYNKSIKELFGTSPKIDLRTVISSENMTNEDCKCRIIYDANDISVEYIPYVRKEIKVVKLIYNNTICYDYKFSERLELDNLFLQREEHDEIIIVKNDLITDAYYYNIVIENEQGLSTPKTPLLKGVMRQCCVDKGILKEADITVDELLKATKVCLINALNPIDFIIIEKIIA